MAKIFLSYARGDQPFAEKLRETLVGWGNEAWMDVHEIRPGTRWWDEIDDGLKQAEAVVGLLSPGAVNSHNVRNEWNWSLMAGRKLVFMRLQKLPPDSLSHRFVGLQWIDYHQDESAGFQRLREILASESPQDVVVGALIPPAAAQAPPPPAQKTGDDNRRKMIENVRSYWIDGVLRQAVNEANRFNVAFELTPGAVVQHIDFSDCALTSDADLGKVFEYLGGELLILGAPGSGKTILLLQLADQMLQAALADPARPIPLVLNLSSWSQKREELGAWIVGEASLAYQISRGLVRRWVDEDAVVPLLDGLDEVLPEAREACVEAINQYRKAHPGIQLAVCSRSGDYALLKSKLDLRAAVVVQPLDAAQVDRIISRPDLAGLRAFWDREPWLREMALSPFLLNVMAYSYAGRSEASLRLPDGAAGEEARRDHLLDTYIHRRFQETTGQRKFSAQQIRSGLSWLAAHMKQRGQSVFHIESLQADWLSRMGDRLDFFFLPPCLIGVVLAMAGYLSSLTDDGSDWDGNSSVGLWVGAMFIGSGVVAATFQWFDSRVPGRRGDWGKLLAFYLGATLFFAGLSCFHVWSFDATPNGYYRVLTGWGALECIWTGALGFCLLAFSTVFLLRGLKIRAPVFAYTIPGGVMAGIAATPWQSTSAPDSDPTSFNFDFNPSPLFIAFFVGLVMSLFTPFGRPIQPTERLRWCWKYRRFLVVSSITYVILLISSICFLNTFDASNLIMLVFISLVPSLLFGLVGGGFFSFERVENVSRRLRPNEGIFKSLRRGIIFASVIIAPAIAIGILAANVIIIFLTIPFAVVAALFGGIDVPIKHYFLRLFLAYREKIPFRLPGFLNSCVEQLLLRRVGGGYIFIHRYLLEYFAKAAKAR